MRRMNFTYGMGYLHKAVSAVCGLVCAAAVTPTALAEDAYIASDGAEQFINTGYFPSGKTKIEVDFQLTSTASGKDCIFGNYGDPGFSVLLYANPNNTYFQFCGKDGGWQGVGTGVAIDTERHTMVIDVPKKTGTMYAADGTVQSQKAFNSSWTYAKKASWPIALLASCTSANGNTARQYAPARIYGAKIWESEDGGKTYELKRDYVPAVKGKAPGLYDKVNGVFVTNIRPSYRNLVSGEPLFEVEDDPCIISDGTAQTGINTGFFWGPDARAEIDFAFDALAPQQMRVVGADQDAAANMAFYLNSANNASWAFNASDETHTSTPHSTTLQADFRRRRIVADQAAKKAYYILAETGETNRTTDIAGMPVSDASVPLALFGNASKMNGLTMTFVANNNSAKARIYGAKFYKGGNLVRDLVPLVKGGIPGFRDRVTGDFLTVDRDAILSGFSASPSTPEEPDDGWVLTSDYDLVAGTTNYISSIDTKYVSTGKTRLELDFALNSGCKASGWPGAWALMVTKAGAAQSRFSMYCDGTKMCVNMGDQLWKSMTPALNVPAGSENVRHKAVLDHKAGTAAFITAGCTNATFSGTGGGDYSYTTTLKLGTYESGTAAYAPLRIYGLKIFEDDALVHDYVPSVKDGVAGLVDVFGNGGFVGCFSNIRQNLAYGGAIRAEGASDAYLESDGTQGINTGCLMKGAETRMEADFALVDARQINVSSGGYQQRVFGQDSGGGLLSALYINGSGEFMFGYGNTFINSHGPHVAADTARHVAVIDGYNDRLYWLNGGATWGVTNKNYDISADAHGNNATWLTGIFATPNNQAATTWRNPAKMRLYTFRVYDRDELVHEYVPYVDGGVACLYDTVDKVVLKDSRNGNAFKIGGMGVDGAEKWLKELPAEASVATESALTLTAAAAGAVRYEWTLDGEVVEGATGESVTAAWRKGGYSTPDIYTCTAIYDVYGTETRGTPVSCAVSSVPPAFVMVVR